MEGASIAGEAFGQARATGSVARRRIVLVVGLVVVTFAAAFGVGGALKHRTAAPRAVQLTPATQANGPQQLSIAGIQSPGAIPGLKSPAKPKPKQSVNTTPAQRGSTSAPNGGTQSGQSPATTGGSQGGGTSSGGGTGGTSNGGGGGGGGGGTSSGGTSSGGGSSG